MKILLFALPLMLIAVSCDRAKDASKEMKDAREDLQEEQKEEAVDYVEESEGAVIDEAGQKVDVEESTDR